MPILEITSILTCSLFAGAAIYINLVEHPARLECGPELASTVFGPSYRRAALMQASLAMLATVSGVGVVLAGGPRLWLAGAVLIFLVVPFTFLVIMSTNKQLLDPERDRTTAETEALLRRWGSLHFRPQHLEPAGGHLVCVSRRCCLSIWGEFGAAVLGRWSSPESKTGRDQ